MVLRPLTTATHKEYPMLHQNNMKTHSANGGNAAETNRGLEEEEESRTRQFLVSLKVMFTFPSHLLASITISVLRSPLKHLAAHSAHTLNMESHPVAYRRAVSQ